MQRFNQTGLISAAITMSLLSMLGCNPPPDPTGPAAEARYAAARRLMVAEQLAGAGRDITNQRVLQVMGEVPRHAFVPENLRQEAYADHPLPIGYEQTISQPYIVAYMTQILEPRPHDRVLEIGTGSGYQAAVLAHLVSEVYSIEIVEPLGNQAAATLQRLGYTNVHVKIGDGYQGWPEHAPFDAIIVTCAPEQVPEALVKQLKEGGRMIIPVGPLQNQQLHWLTKQDGTIRQRAVLPVRFVPMVKAKTDWDWSQLPPLPDPLGVAGAYAGVSGGALLVAGGANFPGKMPWEGGQKVWHETVYALEDPTGPWKIAGALPRPLGYGVSVSHKDAVICAGGSDARGHYADTFRLRWQGGKLSVQPLPALPMPLAFASGALAGEVLFVACGTDLPGEQRATNRLFALDLAAQQPAWRELQPLPGLPRLLAIGAAQADAFYLFGGVTLKPGKKGKIVRDYLREAWRYSARAGWERLRDLPKPCVAAPSPAPLVEGRFLLLAGDDGSRAGFQPPEKHPGFASGILGYHPGSDSWSEAGRVPAPRATLPCVEWRGHWVMPSGEARPGVRSPEVWRLGTR